MQTRNARGQRTHTCVGEAVLGELDCDALVQASDGVLQLRVVVHAVGELLHVDDLALLRAVLACCWGREGRERFWGNMQRRSS